MNIEQLATKLHDLKCDHEYRDESCSLDEHRQFYLDLAREVARLLKEDA